MTAVFVATGAFDCGKTTTLEWLREHHGVRIHAEAHRSALAKLGERTAGHPPGQPFSPINDPEHSCPMCRPWAFARLVLDEQRNIELAAQPGDLLERGFLDPIEMLLRRTDAPDDAAAATTSLGQHCGAAGRASASDQPAARSPVSRRRPRGRARRSGQRRSSRGAGARVHARVICSVIR
jgi:hypothetical protein